MPRNAHIAFVTSNFPSRLHPTRGTFVRQLVDVVAEMGVHCTVIHPWKFHEWFSERAEEAGLGGQITPGVRVHRPLTLSVSNRRLGPVNTFFWTHRSFRRAVWRVIRRLPEKPDATYGHFLYSSGESAIWAGLRLGCPGFVAVGEGTLWTLKPVSQDRARRELAPMAGAIAVSNLLKARLVHQLGFVDHKVAVFPNGVDLRKFYPRNRDEMRVRHGFPADKFLVAYVGNFIESKGVQRVASAIDGLPGVDGVFIGSGPRPPRINNVVFCGQVAHEKVAEYLSAADCFVLPSDAEGSSNATLEAMACSLPVIVTDAEFNDHLVVSGKTGLRVRPDDVGALREALLRLQHSDQLRHRLGEASLARASQLEIRLRARGILDWMAERADAAQFEPKTVHADC